MSSFLEFEQLLNFEVFVPLLILLIQLIKNPVDMLLGKIFKAAFSTMYLVFIICFFLRLLILSLDGAVIDGRMLIVTFANSVFISTSGIGMYDVIKKGREMAKGKKKNQPDAEPVTQSND